MALTTALACFESYLSLKQVVSVLHRESEPSSLLYSIPHGSVLGPILFILASIWHHGTTLCPTSYVCQLLVPALILFFATCKTVSDIKGWTIYSKLKPNKDKTEALLFGLSKSSDLPDVIKIGEIDILFCNSAHNPGAMFDNGLTTMQQVDRICQTAYFDV